MRPKDKERNVAGWISCCAAYERAARASSVKENRMKFAKVTDLNRKPGTARRVLRRLLLAGFYRDWGMVHLAIRADSLLPTHDQARPADAIAVFGAAEYDGRPSPVLRARLDRALALYREHLAPLVITLGGGAVREIPKGVSAMTTFWRMASRRTRSSLRPKAQTQKNPPPAWLLLPGRTT